MTLALFEDGTVKLQDRPSSEFAAESQFDSVFASSNRPERASGRLTRSSMPLIEDTVKKFLVRRRETIVVPGRGAETPSTAASRPPRTARKGPVS